MQLSRFNLWVEDYPQPGECLLFNTRTQALIKVKQGLKEKLKRLPVRQAIDDTELAAFLPALQENGIVVADEQEENDKLHGFFDQLKYGGGVLPFDATILTTYSCNFACTYCFEQSVREQVFMDKQASDQIIRWLISRAEKRGYRQIFLVFYGGEPLLNVRPIYDISWHLYTWAADRGIDFGFGIITNGSLLKPELVDKLLTVGLREVRITIDGDREAHDKKRPFSDGSPSFDAIIKNIKGLIKYSRLKINVAGNFDQQSFESIPRLLDYLEKEEILRRLGTIDFAPLMPRLGPKDNPGMVELKDCFSFIGKNGLHREMVAIKKELLRRSLPMRTGFAINACSLLMHDGGVTIDPTGLIFKCNALVGYPEFAIGTVNDEQFNEKYDQFLRVEAWQQCDQQCPYIPMCQGGCRFFSYMEKNSFSGISCKRDYFDRIAPELIKLEYQKIRKT